MGCWAQNSKPGFCACLMADGALLLICCYAGPLWRKYGSAVKAFCLMWKPFQQSNHRRHFAVKQNDHCREPTWAPQNSINMNSNKLKRLRKIWWVTGEGYPVKTRDMEWDWLDVFWSGAKGVFGVYLDLFLLLFWLGFFWLLLEAKSYFWAGEVALTLLCFLLL